MKPIHKATFFLLCVYFFQATITFSFAQSPEDTLQKHFLEMKGRVMSGEKILSGASIDVFIDDETPFKVYTSDSTGFSGFKLPLQQYFTVKISKQGYVTKILSIDTHVPQNKTYKYFCDFSTDLFEYIPEIDVSILKHPIAKAAFDTISGSFGYDSVYTADINARLRKLYDDYRNRKKNSPLINATPSDSGKTSAQVTPQQKVSYFIQILAAKQKEKKPVMLANAKEVFENGMYKYSIGEFATFSEAKRNLDNLRVNFPDAFITAFSGGKKITLAEARAITDK
jgi:hypothetical protein